MKLKLLRMGLALSICGAALAACTVEDPESDDETDGSGGTGAAGSSGSSGHNAQDAGGGGEAGGGEAGGGGTSGASTGGTDAGVGGDMDAGTGGDMDAGGAGGSDAGGGRSGDGGTGGAAGDGGAAGETSAGLLGAEVAISAHCCTAPPSEDNQLDTTRTATVGPDIEFPSGTTQGAVIPNTVDVSASAIEIVYTQSAVANAGSFNGYWIKFSGENLPKIVGAILADSTTVPLDQSRIAFDENSVSVNGASLLHEAGAVVHIDLLLED